ncbi:hypothetical protein Pan216_50390 [Planctomycetes bacterium Pan216]|uniref:Carboxypeptidase regulatory-like domain-containing protein n=1 Tax=Kolteria novifilia TaxID=2527975 RepID=A0A518BAY6_9BACT|nr:hypothetical protein Pan216_50390 [Planctomycetes bacterium Pan216]
MRVAWRRGALAIVLGLLTLGCGPTSSGRHTVSGTVTYDTKPLPKGRVMFEPDAGAGNRGPSGSAEIVDGKFTTSRNMGVIGGPYIVRIYGPPVESGSMNHVDFPPFETKHDFPDKDTEVSFDIPAAK